MLELAREKQSDREKKEKELDSKCWSWLPSRSTVHAGAFGRARRPKPEHAEPNTRTHGGDRREGGESEREREWSSEAQSSREREGRREREGKGARQQMLELAREKQSDREKKERELNSRCWSWLPSRSTVHAGAFARARRPKPEHAEPNTRTNEGRLDAHDAGPVSRVWAGTVAADAHDAGPIPRASAGTIAADAHDAGRVPQASATTIAADAHDAGRVPRVSARTFAADAHDAGRVLRVSGVEGLGMLQKGYWHMEGYIYIYIYVCIYGRMSQVIYGDTRFISSAPATAFGSTALSIGGSISSTFKTKGL